jgi:hypothetical protein
MKVTNNSKSMQGIHTLHGVRYIQPGESKELVISVSQAKRTDRLDFIDLDGDPVEDPASTFGAVAADGKDGVYIPADQFNAMRSQFEAMEAENRRLREELDGGSSLDREDLKKQAGELGIEYPRNIPTEKLKELIDIKLAS